MEGQDRLVPGQDRLAGGGGLIAIISIVLIGGVSGVTILDVVDAFSNNIGIVGGALIAVVMATWVYRRLDSLAAALNRFGSFKVGRIWKTLLGIVLPVVLTVLLGDGHHRKSWKATEASTPGSW